MKKLESISSNLLFLFHCFLVMLLIFENSVSIPYWLQPLGRMHPLILHFPIAFIVLLVILSFLKKQIDSKSFQKINRFLVLFTSFTTVIATIMGLFLSLESTPTELMTLHKWIGVVVSFLIYFLTFIKKETLYKTVLYIGFICVLFTGHFGAGLTHGANFITEPLAKVESIEINENTPIFIGFVKPILDAKCVSCHNAEKQKGDLDMTSFEKMMLGGKKGKLWISKNPEESSLLKRAHLPIEHEKHMPPEGKKQLTSEEIKLLSAWINQGANEKITLTDLPANDALGVLIKSRLKTIDNKKKLAYTFDFADKKDIEALENPFRTVIQKSPSSPAIDVVIHGRQTFKQEFITDLSKIKKQIVSLNLSYLPIDKNSINFISSLHNLEDLLLNFTNVNTEDLEAIKTCSNLKNLGLSGTQVDANIAPILKHLPKLNNVFIWNTSISEDDIKILKSEFTTINFETGFISLGDTLQLTPPILVSKKTILDKEEFIELGHKIQNVEIRYTTDGSKPDSTSTLYKRPLKIDFANKKPIKTIAYKKNWLASEIKDYSFSDKGYTPEKFELIHQGLNSEFIGEAKTILIDHIKGGKYANSSPFWATFSEKNYLNAVADFGANPPDIKKVIFSYGMRNNQKKESLALLEIWAGENKNNLSLIKHIKKNHNKIIVEKGGQRQITLEIPKSKNRYYKIVGIPHKKEKLYVDQVFFY
ncbi:FN3 associated domain-containing protein [uncultured Maribacter sp.]|uniref:FN3 associated domain-containing protein n=1 Tax=uncultured Maribacter sp. TaxID=431308 RepID=UPI002639D521|nr:FN3 associated domain-containing protein [uncultured Maribacter sp.]